MEFAASLPRDGKKYTLLGISLLLANRRRWRATGFMRAGRLKGEGGEVCDGRLGAQLPLRDPGPARQRWARALGCPPPLPIPFVLFALPQPRTASQGQGTPHSVPANSRRRAHGAFHSSKKAPTVDSRRGRALHHARSPPWALVIRTSSLDTGRWAPVTWAPLPGGCQHSFCWGWAGTIYGKLHTFLAVSHVGIGMGS